MLPGDSYMVPSYDVFLSHSWSDGDRPRQIYEALTKAGLRVWFDATEIKEFTSITHAVTEGLARSKALLAYYSQTYPLRRACQWELTAAFLAARAEGDPRRRVMVINPQQTADHIHPIELRDAKFCAAPVGDGPALNDLVQAIVERVTELEGPLPDIHPLSAPTWHGMTPLGSTRFIGRLREMWEVHSLLHAGDVPLIGNTPVATGGIGRISGLAGVGKSLLAEEYALHLGSAYPGGVFWLRAYGTDDAQTTLAPEQREALRTDQMRQIAERLGIDTHEMKEEQQVEGALARKIAAEGKACLWIVDDLPSGLDGQTLRRWCAPHALAHTLVTTRSGGYGSLLRGIDLSVLAPEEAYQLLTSRRVPASTDEEEQARLLAACLGYHPLALDVNASALLSSAADNPFAAFRGKMARPDEDALVFAEKLADVLPNGHEKSIAQTMLRSICELGAEGLDFLRLASTMATAPIPASLVVAVFQRADKLCQEDAEERATLGFHQVTVASLAEVAGIHQEARAVHSLVSRTVRFQEKGSPERTPALRAAVIVALTEEIAEKAVDPRLHEQIEFQVMHARQVASIPTTADEATLVSWVARYDLERGSYASARRLQEQALDIRRRALGSEHPSTLTSMSNLAMTLHHQGDLAGACKLQEETMEINRRVLGPKNLETLLSTNNFAQTLQEQGAWQEARELQEETIDIARRTFGHEHICTLASMNNLALTLRAQGDLTGALRLQEESLEILSRLLGAEHPDTLASMNNLADTMGAQGNLTSARKLQEGVLDIRCRVLGREHPETVTSMNSLAMTLHLQGDFAEARKLQEKTLDIARRVLGLEHPNTLGSMNNLAAMLRERGDLTGARELQEETLDIVRRVLGLEHPNTLISMSNVAETLCMQGDLAGARKLQEEVLDIRRRVLGLGHPDTITSMNNVAATLYMQGDLAGARKLQEGVLDIRRRVLGLEHPDTLTSMNNVAATLYTQGYLIGARKLQEGILHIQRRVLGPQHSAVSVCAWNLFRTLQSLNKPAAARAVLKRDLLWLLDRPPATLSGDQRTIRAYVATIPNKNA